MTLNQMKYFIAAARCLSFTEAAKSLFMTQPALSRQIAAMEHELGTKLFVREHKNLKLTPGGSILLNRLPELLEDYRKLADDVRNANRGYDGHLRIGILDVYDISDLFEDTIQTFQKYFPDTHLTMERFGIGKLTECLYQNSLDLIVTYGFSLYDQPDLITLDIQKYNSCIMLRRDHPLAGKKNLSLSDLQDETFVLLDRAISEEGYHYIMSLCEKCGIFPRTKVVEKMEDILLWVQTGNGAAITTDRTIEKMNPTVVIREIEMPEAKGHDITVAWRRENYNPAIAMFMEIIQKKIAGTEK